jgi:ABC-type multidrug transport system fused ATPase/permease subunit
MDRLFVLALVLAVIWFLVHVARSGGSEKTNAGKDAAGKTSEQLLAMITSARLDSDTITAAMAELQSRGVDAETIARAEASAKERIAEAVEAMKARRLEAERREREVYTEEWRAKAVQTVGSTCVVFWLSALMTAVAGVAWNAHLFFVVAAIVALLALALFCWHSSIAAMVLGVIYLLNFYTVISSGLPGVLIIVNMGWSYFAFKLAGEAADLASELRQHPARTT